MASFDLSAPVNESIIPVEEQMRVLRDQLEGRKRDRESLKLQYQRADAVMRQQIQEQADTMTAEIEALEAQLSNLEGGLAASSRKGKKNVAQKRPAARKAK